MKNPFKIFIFLIPLLFLLSCVPDMIKEEANQKFGDQHFKTAIALIELHNIRNEGYPESLDKLEFVGEWDAIVFSSVKYKKLEVGYELDLVNGFMGKPEKLNYPAAFWNGLGLVKSNIKK